MIRDLSKLMLCLAGVTMTKVTLLAGVEKNEKQVSLQVEQKRCKSSSAMLIKEYRIPLPLTVEEYRIAQLYMIAVSSLFFFEYWLHTNLANHFF